MKTADSREDLETEWADTVWDSIISLLSCPWFERLWVFQKVRLADDVDIFCGDPKIPWDRFVQQWYDYTYWSCSWGLLCLYNWRLYGKIASNFARCFRSGETLCMQRSKGQDLCRTKSSWGKPQQTHLNLITQSRRKEFSVM